MYFLSTPWSSVANNPILDILDLESSLAVAACNRYQVSSPVSLSLKMPQFLIRSAIRYSVTYKELEDGTYMSNRYSRCSKSAEVIRKT